MKKPHMIFGYTKAAFSSIRKELNTIGLVINIITQIILLLVTLYLISLHKGQVMYLIAYSWLEFNSLLLFTLSIIFKKKEDDSKEVAEIKKKRFKISKRISRIFKYVLKLAIILIALYDMNTNGANFLSKVTILLSFALIIIQLMIDLISFLINRYIEYLKLSISLDTKNKNPHLIHNAADVIASHIQEEDEYSEDEKVIIEKLNDEQEIIYTVQKKNEEQKFKKNLSIIKDHIFKKLKKK